MSTQKKTWLITKQNNALTATFMFGEEKVNITTKEHPVLGSQIGKAEFIANSMNEKVKIWCDETTKLSEYGDS